MREILSVRRKRETDHRECVRLRRSSARCDMLVRNVQVVWMRKAKRTDRTKKTRCELSLVSSITRICSTKTSPSMAPWQYSTPGITRSRCRGTLHWRSAEISYKLGRYERTSYNITWLCDDDEGDDYDERKLTAQKNEWSRIGIRRKMRQLR